MIKIDILFSEREKKIVQFTITLMRRKFHEGGKSASIEKVHDDMINCGNDGIREIAKIINETCDKIETEYHSATVRELSELGLWVCYKDTAYRDVFFWVLDKILSIAPLLRIMIKPYVKPPNKWTINTWQESKRITKRKIEKGEILEGQVSDAEAKFVPKIQKYDLSRLLGRDIRR